MKPHVAARWETAVLVCRKCSKKLKGGFGRDGRTPLAKALRKQLRLKKGRKARAGIIEVDCVDICPKGAVTVIDTARPGKWRLVQPGENLTALAHELGLDRPETGARDDPGPVRD